MTKEEMQKKTNEKVDKIKALCVELQIKLSAENKILENMVIRPVVFFNDTEEYPKDETTLKTIKDKVKPKTV